MVAWAPWSSLETSWMWLAHIPFRAKGAPSPCWREIKNNFINYGQVSKNFKFYPINKHAFGETSRGVKHFDKTIHDFTRAEVISHFLHTSICKRTQIHLFWSSAIKHQKFTSFAHNLQYICLSFVAKKSPEITIQFNNQENKSVSAVIPVDGIFVVDNFGPGLDHGTLVFGQIHRHDYIRVYSSF